MGICIYCQNEFLALTEEHVIPEMFYLKELRRSNITHIRVPVCGPCNQSAQKIQERVRAWFVLLSSDTNKVAEWLGKNELMRSFQRKPRLKSIIAGKVTLTDLRTGGGIYIGSKAAEVKLNDEDWKNLESFLDLVLRGVMYYVHRLVIPRNSKIIHLLGFERYYFKPKDDLKNWLKENKDALVFTEALREVYCAWSGFVPETTNCTVVSLFYGKLSFRSIAWDDEDCPEDIKKMFGDNQLRIR